MLTTLLALCFAVLLAIGYAVVASQPDDASVGRRQIDTWAVALALACLLFMGTGAADAAREASVRRGQVAQVRAELQAAPQVAVRHRRPSLRQGPGAAALSEAPPSGAAAPRVPDDPVEALVVDPLTGAPVEDLADEPYAYDGETPPLDELAPAGVLADPAAGASIVQPGAESPWTPPLVGAWPVPTPRAVAYASPTPTRLPIEPLPPTPLPPTPPMQALPTATPHCGVASAIDVALQIQSAQAERRDDELVVRYTAAFTNRSPFPVTVADLSVTALSGSSGSELYGHEAKPDMLLAPSDRVVFEGAVTLDKAPSPFGTTELCIAFVGETCGQRRPYEVQRRCMTVRGF
jgi:hypothetical protein